MEFKTSISIDSNRIADLIITALEGGSNYWYSIDKKKSKAPSPDKLWQFPEGDSLRDTLYFHVQWPLSEGGSVHIYDNETGDYRGDLNLESLQKGLDVMQDKYPKHMADFLSEHEDGDTADVFLQCCLFGEVIFG